MNKLKIFAATAVILFSAAAPVFAEGSTLDIRQ